MEDKNIKLHFAILYGIIGILILVVLILSIALRFHGKDHGTGTTESDTVQTTETDDSTETTTDALNATTAVTTYPPATVPSGSAASVAQKRALPSLEDIKQNILSLDNTLRGWGPGTDVDEANRPYGAISAQKTYGKYDSTYIMSDNKIYLTFDEGYENGYTEEILDILKEKNVKAVFFITMSYAKREPDLIRRMIDEGHIVGNHSTAHLSFPGMTLEDAYADIKALHDYVYDHFGYSMSLFRFPMGESSDRTQALLQELGYTSVFWSFAYKDWETDNQPLESEAFAKITGCAHPGAIYLLHAVSKTNAELLPSIIDDFRQNGYEIALYPVS